MYCIVRSSSGILRIESTSYWQSGSYKMLSIDKHLKSLGKSLSIEYYNHNGEIIDKIILGKISQVV